MDHSLCCDSGSLGPNTAYHRGCFPSNLAEPCLRISKLNSLHGRRSPLRNLTIVEDPVSQHPYNMTSSLHSSSDLLSSSEHNIDGGSITPSPSLSSLSYRSSSAQISSQLGSPLSSNSELSEERPRQRRRIIPQDLNLLVQSDVRNAPDASHRLSMKRTKKTRQCRTNTVKVERGKVRNADTNTLRLLSNQLLHSLEKYLFFSLS